MQRFVLLVTNEAFILSHFNASNRFRMLRLSVIVQCGLPFEYFSAEAARRLVVLVVDVLTIEGFVFEYSRTLGTHQWLGIDVTMLSGAFFTVNTIRSRPGSVTTLRTNGPDCLDCRVCR